MKSLYSALSNGRQYVDRAPSSTTDGTHEAAVIPEHSWRTGFCRRFPCIGIGVLSLSIICTAFACLTIAYCNGKAVSEWRHALQPTEILAYTSAAANWLMGLVLAEGANIFFWTKVVRGNVPLANLHYHWEAATGGWGAFKALIRRRAFRVGFATLVVAVTSLLRGPMMQRVLSVRTVQLGRAGILELGVLPTTQVWDLEPLDDYDWKHPFWDAIREYRAKAPISIPGAESCNNCTVAVELLGFEYVEATSNTLAFDFSQRPMKSNSRRDEDIFRISSDANPHYVTVSVKRKVNKGCQADITTKEYFLYPASVKYQVLLNGGNATFLSNSWKDDYIVGRRELEFSSNYTMNNRLNYFRVMVDKLWATQTTLTVAWGNVSIERTMEGVFYDPIITENAQEPQNKIQYRLHSDGLIPDLYQEERGNKCGPKYQDPVDDILNTYRELALRLAVSDALSRSEAANGAAGNSEEKSKVFQTVEFTRPFQIRVEYAADIYKLRLAIVVSLAGPLAASILYWGFWELGRDFSMSPLELANAFQAGGSARTMRVEIETDSDTDRMIAVTETEVTDADTNKRFATIFQSFSSNASAKKILRGIRQGSKEPRVQYGVLDSTKRLGFAILSSEDVTRPQENESFKGLPRYQPFFLVRIIRWFRYRCGRVGAQNQES
ncbi:hypothetical protein B0T20DRAFT_129223 [Sordaria brevicollis]|uniref:Uncharacterized protein n=1 Tax=Sordaria brevicollis TaxID=83679 RepID=A0AAE0PL77_SORBR|nr:hypothetical protein B0T20DRAFT_129223 [Sordaria brevicollis]